MKERKIIVTLKAATDEDLTAIHKFITLVANLPQHKDVARVAQKIVSNPALINTLFKFL